MPRPVEALPCGSRSTISTASPIAASAVPRLIAVVVLPTPPFWLAIARTRGCPGALRAIGSTGISGLASTSAGKSAMFFKPLASVEAADDQYAALWIGDAGRLGRLDTPTFR